MERILKLQNCTLYVYDYEVIDSRTYMLREENSVLLIDPCVSDVLAERMRGAEHGLVYLTHEHFDHISGVNWVRQQLDCEVWCTDGCAGRLAEPRYNLSRTFPLLFLQDKEKYRYVRTHMDTSYTCAADCTYAEENRMAWRGHSLYMRSTPGHSPGSSMLFVDDMLLFAGDSLLGNGLELKSLGADKKAYREQVLQYVRSLDQEILVCPGHGDLLKLGDVLDKIQQYIG